MLSARFSKVALALAAAAAVGWGGVALAQAPAPQPDYHPSLADIMTMAVQPRHAKLGIAGKTRNWAYLAYETSELRSAFARVARTVPTFRQQDMAAMIAAGVKDPIDAMEAAVKARDGQKFDAAYARTTEACNSCHIGMDKAYVVIRAPVGTGFPDQDFALPPPRKGG
jgi:hypothetical protein